MGWRWASLASGSKGNCSLLINGGFTLMIDCGISLLALRRRLGNLGLTLEQIDALIITHLHNDHIRGLDRLLCRRPDLPILTRRVTATALGLTRSGRQVWELAMGRPFRLNDLSITPLPLSHDAPDTFGLVIETPAGKLVHLTDLGEPPNCARDLLENAQLMVLETNHDPEMLRTGPYPWFLKKRIASREGHLSNHQARELVQGLMYRPERLVLAHLSETNNHPELAAEAMRGLCPQVEVALQGETLEIRLG